MNALILGKYFKDGPAVISEGSKAIKAARGIWVANSKKWKAMKDGAIEDVASIGYQGFIPGIIEKLNKCCYVREITSEAQNMKK